MNQSVGGKNDLSVPLGEHPSKVPQVAFGNVMYGSNRNPKTDTKLG